MFPHLHHRVSDPLAPSERIGTRWKWYREWLWPPSSLVMVDMYRYESIGSAVPQQSLCLSQQSLRFDRPVRLEKRKTSGARWVILLFSLEFRQTDFVDEVSVVSVESATQATKELCFLSLVVGTVRNNQGVSTVLSREDAA